MERGAESHRLEPETITALSIAISGLITGLLTAIGLCLRQSHIKHLKCCNIVDVDIANTPNKTSLDLEKGENISSNK